MFVVVLIIVGLVSVNATPCSRDESLNITGGISFENGSVIHDGWEYVDGTWYVLDIDGLAVSFGCPCIGRVCLWKCCGFGQMFLNRSCADVDVAEANPFNPPVFKGREPSNVTAVQHFFYMPRQSCDMYVVDSNSPAEEIYLQENGTLFEIAANRPQWHPPILFCLDMKLDDTSPKSRLVAGVCYPDSGSLDDSPGLYIAYGVGLMLSVPFLLATFLVYAFIPELRNLHGMCLMAYCGGLIVAYPFLAYLKLHTGKVGVAMTGCFIIAFIIYYAFQSSFFWLNVMCFDIWRTFSGYRGGSSSKRREKKRFAMYAAYAWGVPALLTAVTIGMQFGANIPDDVITPGFGNRRCWFDNWVSELVYFFTPVFVLVVCNVVFFSVTANRIRSIKQETAILKGAESSRSDKLKKDKQRYGLYLKLFVIMGVNWSVEVISFAVGGSNWYWIIVDLSNIALGIYIFFIFVWKNKVRSLVVKKLVSRFKRFFRSTTPLMASVNLVGGLLTLCFSSCIYPAHFHFDYTRWRSVRGIPAETTLGTWGTRSSSAPTEDTRISADDTGMRLREMR